MPDRVEPAKSPADGSVQALAERVSSSPELQEMIKSDPVNALHALSSPLQSDVLLYRIVVSAIGGSVVITILGAILLAVLDKEIPEVLVAIGSAAVGALAGLLAPSPVRG